MARLKSGDVMELREKKRKLSFKDYKGE